MQSLNSLLDFVMKHTITFVTDPPERLKCMICKDILKNAKQTSCGCKVCEMCIKEYLKGGQKRCPNEECAETMLSLDKDILQDNATNKEISALTIKCPFGSCKESANIKVMIDHVKTCENREVICEKCGEKYSFNAKANHEKDECSQRTVECRSCKSRMTAKDLQSIHHNIDHVDLCSEYITDCPNECGVTKTRIKEHLKKCTFKREECPFEPLKCNIGKLSKVKLSEHLQEEMVPHLTTFISEVFEMKEQIEQLQKEVFTLKSTVESQMKITQTLTEARKIIERSVEDLRKRGPGMTSTFEKSAVFRNGSFIWKICDFDRLKGDAESGGRSSVTSDPFYTSDFGYKMCLRVYPAGDGAGRGTHLSVFFAIMKGEFDDLLGWPFKQKVTLSLLDQENYGSKNHSDTFKPDARSACYQKPTDDCNIASGSPKFIPLKDLIPHSNYFKSGCIFLKISVDTIGISKP